MTKAKRVLRLKNTTYGTVLRVIRVANYEGVDTPGKGLAFRCVDETNGGKCWLPLDVFYTWDDWVTLPEEE